MCEYLPIEPDACTLCAKHPEEDNKDNLGSRARILPFRFVTPKIAILTLVLLLNHDIKRDWNKPGFWHNYDEGGDAEEEQCPLCCNSLQCGQMVVETSCLHRYHYDCILHFVLCHRGKFCCDQKCSMRIF